MYLIYVNNFESKGALGKNKFFLSALSGVNRCLRCGFVSSNLLPLCPKCVLELQNYVPLNSPRRCVKCGKLLVSEMEICMECRERDGESSLDALFPLHSYRQWKKELAFAWKSEGQRRLSPLFGRLLFKALRETGWHKFQLVPVPPRPGKIKERGWDQVADLAQYLKKKRKIMVREDILVRKSQGQQKKLGRDERLGAAGAVYELRPEFGAVLEGGAAAGTPVPAQVVLLDDIVTTGATMEKCAWLLKAAGAQKVYGLALFRVD